VHFQNSHSLFPTFTTANASAIATGHGLGDTGDFSNYIWPGYAAFDTGNFNLPAGTPTPFLENDQVLADLDDHFHGNYLGEETLLTLARAHGYNTAVVGKLGPAAIQAAGAIAPHNGVFPPGASTIVVDDSTGAASGVPLPPPLLLRLQQAHLPTEAPTRSNGYGATSQYNNGYTGDNARAGTLRPNIVQEQWFVDVTTEAILPMFEAEGDRPFVLVFWSRDPDGTQHYQGDSLGGLYPGINGVTSRLAVQNADRCLQALLAWLDAHPSIKADTDVFVTSDHGFATISRREIDRTGRPTTSEAARHFYLDASGRAETDKGTLPNGFLAIDLAVGLRTNLFDPDRHAPDGVRGPYRKLRIDFDTWEHPVNGNGLLGTDVLKLDGSDARAIVAANGGSDLIYVPDGNADTVRSIVDLLFTFDYVGGVFVDDRFGKVPGTLPLSAIGLVGASAVPRPAIVVAFKFFYLNPADLQTAIQVADTSLQEGQGMHGGFGRDSTYNNMAAMGPDFKTSTVDDAPVDNADIAPTLARVLGLEAEAHGSLRGRVIVEALRGGPDAVSAPATKYLASPPIAPDGRQTVLAYQEHAGKRYARTACLVPREAGRQPTCP
jgi:arylsulfatase A-like enzyme